MEVDGAIGNETAVGGCGDQTVDKVCVVKHSDEVRALFEKAGIGQDGTVVHISLETEEEATKAFEYVCDLGSGQSE